MGSAVKALLAPSQDEFRSPIWIFFDLIVPQTHYRPPCSFEIFRSAVVIIHGFSVLTAIQFDGQFGLPASEIQNVRLHDQLAGETWAILPQTYPQQALRPGRAVTELAGVGSHMLGDALHFALVSWLANARTHPRPLPLQGGEVGQSNKLDTLVSSAMR